MPKPQIDFPADLEPKAHCKAFEFKGINLFISYSENPNTACKNT